LINLAEIGGKFINFVEIGGISIISLGGMEVPGHDFNIRLTRRGLHHSNEHRDPCSQDSEADIWNNLSRQTGSWERRNR